MASSTSVTGGGKRFSDLTPDEQKQFKDEFIKSSVLRENQKMEEERKKQREEDEARFNQN